MRIRSETTSLLIGLSTLPALQGCGSERIDAAVVAGCTLEREQWTTEFWMVTALIRMKQYEPTPSDAAAQSVLQACRNVLEVDPSHYTATKTSAQAQHLLGDYNAEEKYWKRAGELAETDSERLNCLGSSLQAVGRSGDWVRSSSSFDILPKDITPRRPRHFGSQQPKRPSNPGDPNGPISIWNNCGRLVSRTLSRSLRKSRGHHELTDQEPDLDIHLDFDTWRRTEWVRE